MVFTDSFMHGGTERQFVQSLRHLDRDKYDVSVGCLKRTGPFLAEVEALGIPVTEFPLNSLHNLRAARLLWRLARFLRRQRIDILHAFDFYTSIFAVPAARLAGVPIVIASRRELLTSRTFGQRCAIRFACEFATHIVTNSQAAVSALLGLRNRKVHKVTIVPNGVDLDEFRPTLSTRQVRAQLGIDDHTPLVGIVAVLRPEKDVATFLRAASLVSTSVPSARFLVIGDGGERAKLEALAQELRLPPRVLFLGDRSDVPNLLSALDVFVLTSRAESFPNAALEAMAMGLPVAATDVGGTFELIVDRETGFLGPAGNAEGIARRIAELLRNPYLRRTLGAAGAARARNEFGSTRMKERLENLYDRLLRERRPVARILQIGNYPPPVCGWSLHTQLLHRELSERGVHSRVMDIGPSRRVADRDCIPVYSGLDYAVKLLTYRLRGYTFQVHVNGDSWKGYLLVLAAVLLGRLTSKPSVLMFRAGPKQLYFPRQRGFWFHAFRLLFLASGNVLCNFEPVKRAIRSYGIPEEKIYAIAPFSIQYKEKVPVPLPETIDRFLEAHRPLLTSYLLLRPEYTMECLLEAFAALRRDYPRAGWVVAGPQQISPAVEAAVRRLRLESTLLMPGNLPHAQFLTVVSRSDVFVRTAVIDGVCASILEALDLGVPVVAAQNGHRPPSVITYAPGDAQDLKHVLAEVLANLSDARARIRPPEPCDNLETEISVLLEAAGCRAVEADENPRRKTTATQ